MQLSYCTLSAWPMPSLVLHAWGSEFERNCTGVTMIQSAYRQAYRQGRCPVTSPAPSAAPGWVRGQSGDLRVAAFWQIFTASSWVRLAFFQTWGAASVLLTVQPSVHFGEKNTLCRDYSTPFSTAVMAVHVIKTNGLRKKGPLNWTFELIRIFKGSKFLQRSQNI